MVCTEYEYPVVCAGTVASRAHVISAEELERAFHVPVFRATTSRSRATRTAPARRPARWSWRRSRATRAASPHASTRSQYAPTCAAQSLALKWGLLVVLVVGCCSCALARRARLCVFVRPSSLCTRVLRIRIASPNRIRPLERRHTPHRSLLCHCYIRVTHRTACSFYEQASQTPYPPALLRLITHYSQSQHSWRAQYSKQPRKNGSEHIDFLFARTTMFPVVKTMYFTRSSSNIPSSV